VFLLLQGAMLVVMASLSAATDLPLFATVAFLPIVLRGIAWTFQKPEALDVQWLGVTELLHAITFGVLLITSFHLPR
jgi:hypothetical protein